ncbi:hypothetical protein HEK616_27940 [Streptomyces nigrescens]|uniref:Secreted protein n=2 Tax=Streptomyces TaxID=1883 RepID=A0ABN6QSY5_STRNI|nr:DUF748 domain-containing protein [Streptomyces nigrescens]MEE4418343.1 DUF748 domain-containing protein [Streptomyces sp. DSM 41528]BDM69307.1 hypothetical protein HEK616_27940 [Streptomyces nigrescens]
MNTPVKITAFAAALAASFGVAYGVGSVVTPVTAAPEAAAHAGHGGSGSAGGAGEHAAGGHDMPPGGLQISQDGYTLDLKTPQVRAARATELRFAIRNEAGQQVTAYRREHGKELHLILATRDLGTYQHLHPTRAADGTWRIKAELPAAGAYRLFADFTPDAEEAKNLTLGADLAATGTYRPAPLPAPATVAKVDDYTVTLDGRLRAGKESELTLKVTKNGRPVTDLQPYLGAYGHLVALRSGDLAYLHVHPNGAPGDGKTKPGPEVSFTAMAPSAGAYRLFLDFRHEGKVRTAAFTVDAARA